MLMKAKMVFTELHVTFSVGQYISYILNCNTNTLNYMLAHITVLLSTDVSPRSGIFFNI